MDKYASHKYIAYGYGKDCIDEHTYLDLVDYFGKGASKYSYSKSKTKLQTLEVRLAEAKRKISSLTLSLGLLQQRERHLLEGVTAREQAAALREKELDALEIGVREKLDELKLDLKVLAEREAALAEREALLVRRERNISRRETVASQREIRVIARKPDTTKIEGESNTPSGPRILDLE